MKEITPKALRCTVGGCPSLFEVAEGDEQSEVAVIGRVRPEIAERLAAKIGTDEFCVVVSKALLQNIEWGADEAAGD